jgi:GTP cyclohydrolase II
MHVPERVIRPQLCVIARAQVPTVFGSFDMHVFRWADDTPTLNLGSQGPSSQEHGLSPDHVALAMGELAGQRDVLVRVHSECLTSEVFGSLKCDCRQQLQAAQERIAREGLGAVLYLRQEGRGIGLANKIRAYELQRAGADTVDANRLLGLPDDARSYDAAAAMLQHLGVESVRLMTNNPAKVSALRDLGVIVTSREPSIVSTNPFSEGYLETKRARMGHALPEPALGSDAE